ncbi:CCA tRNA nucleotidyltransferase [Candidatus Uabimicrobium amorphum]|uniref:Cytidine(C)-cytidine(C)-adenosine (A)]-addingenzyme n=1 Tax=Uabimicrobium amorphum TaxID=2596890 RepID=A0A5S9IJE5_UABAM|nr:CCA tRNA nucleotidyltransferase [Candidatus Uabimicrobium amorphum]BBM81715.1 cytidine(C)-cytidine(C)-adenosine (A)]-addingenzyme [Candidatus Uabimicrobium amorphum]
MDDLTLATEIVSRLQQKQFIAYLCGGCVRDQLLQRKPKDYDIVTSARPEEIKKIFHVAVEVGMKFGIVCVKFKGQIFEVATFRKDGDYIDGRRPENIEFSDEIQDAKRRDFTINGLFFDPVAEKVIDHIDGQKDLQRKIVRTIGDPYERFGEDHLRLMRAIRFATQLDFALCDTTWDAVDTMSKSIETVAKERVREEFVKMLMGQDPERAIVLLKESGMLNVLFPHLLKDGVVFDKTRQMLRKFRPFTDETFALCSFLFFSFKEDNQQVVQFCEKLRFANKTHNQVMAILENGERCFHLLDLNVASLKRFLRQSNIADVLNLHCADCDINELSKKNYEFAQQSLQKFGDKLFPAKVINGYDLKEMGVPPGPLYKKILYDVEDQQLLGNINSYEQAIHYVRDKWLQRERIEIEKFEEEKI